MPSEITSILQLFLRHRQVTTDSRSVREGDIFFALRGDRFDGNTFAQSAIDQGASLVVVDNPQVFNQLKAKELKATMQQEEAGQFKVLVEDALISLQDLATAYRRCWQIPVFAITGSNGKTTTKELITAVMSMRYQTHATQGNYNNHIGVPLTILSTPEDAEICILEMGANHQKEIADLCRIAEPTHGLITNIGQAHLEGFGGREGIKKGKGEMFDWLGKSHGIGFVNLDQKEVVELGAKLHQGIEFGHSDAPSLAVKTIEVGLLRSHPNCRVVFLDEHGEHFTADTQLPGKHNFENIKAAVAVGKYFKVPGHAIASALENYRSENARSQRLQHRGVNFFWDAYNANPTSVKAALDAFALLEQKPKAAILGEMLELGEESEDLHKELARYAQQLDIEQLLLVGDAYKKVSTELGLPFFSNSQLLKDWFWEQDWEAHLIFVKGSRAVALEALIK
ncbi:MAG: UDP-N-acetylmuramoyl-tripeptide--D-alanyl-D-alanine ligase [Bacteroidota bacterium]